VYNVARSILRVNRGVGGSLIKKNRLYQDSMLLRCIAP
jgi:hypothetical protein